MDSLENFVVPQEIFNLAQSHGVQPIRIHQGLRAIQGILYQQLEDWFRKEHYLHFYVGPYGDTENWAISGWTINNIGRTDVQPREQRLYFDIRHKYEFAHFPSHREALNTCFLEAFELIKK